MWLLFHKENALAIPKCATEASPWCFGQRLTRLMSQAIHHSVNMYSPAEVTTEDPVGSHSFTKMAITFCKRWIERNNGDNQFLIQKYHRTPGFHLLSHGEKVRGIRSYYIDYTTLIFVFHFSNIWIKVGFLEGSDGWGFFKKSVQKHLQKETLVSMVKSIPRHWTS